ncbi:PIN domain-containing protein [Stenotrophomonas lactitubi]|uniref:PIN domain-containing protein n=1 Tax=Stenotrophomonas lactitubi TaxID=2045214 RepID=UPI0032098769
MDMPLARNVILIDYENVQPPSLKELLAPGFSVLVFVGASQAKISMDVVEAMHALGTQGRYVRCNGHGSNALDFHIAFYIGEMAATDPGTCFHIVSKDTGFDPLLAHLRSRGLTVGRSTSVAELPMLRAATKHPAAVPPPPKKPPPPTPPKPKPAQLSEALRLQHVCGQLLKQGKARPTRLKSLGSAVHTMFQKTLPDSDVTALIHALQQKKWIVLEGQAVRYQLPAKAT